MVSDYLTGNTFSDPAVPMIQLPMKFRSRRQATNVRRDPDADGYCVDILEVEGAGCVRHIWLLFGAGRRLEIMVDGAAAPQIDLPQKPFFGIMHDLTPYPVDNAAYTVLPNYHTPKMPGSPGYNLYLPIPFSRSCRIRLHLDQDAPEKGVSSMVDWHQYDRDVPLTPFRLGAEHNRYTPAPPRNRSYRMAEVSGSGFLAGIVLGVKQRNPTDMIYHTGGMSILVDGETAPNVIRGINMEDDFGFSWGFHLNQTRWIGSPYHKWGGRTDQDGVIYRFFGPDPIAFESSLSFRCGSRDDDVESVAYYYHVPGTEAAPVRTPEHWLVTGFYDNGDDWAAFNTAEEVERIPLEDWQQQFDQRRHFIRLLPANRGWIDFRFSGIDPELHAGNFVDRSMYAGGYVDCDREGAATLRISFDDWLILWVNGDRIAALRHDDGFATVRVPVTLRKGRNELLLKTNNLGHPAQCWVTNLVIEE